MRDACFRSFLGGSPPPIGEAWEGGNTPEHVNQRIEEQRLLAARRQVRLPEDVTNNYTIDRNEIERLRRDLERTITVLEIERREKETIKKKYDDLVLQFRHHGKRIEELSQQLTDERKKLTQQLNDELNEYGIKLEEKNFEYQTLKEEYDDLEKEYQKLLHR